MLHAFSVALRGLALAWIQELHLKVHSGALLAVCVMGWWLKCSAIEWALLALCFGLVFALEYVNSALERLANRVTRETDALVRDAKDMAAGAVLLASLASAAVGLLILGPKLIDELRA